MERSNRSARAEYWQSVVQEFAESKLTVSAFCEQKGISVQSFYQWKRKLKEDTYSKGTLVPVRIVSTPPRPALGAIQIMTPGGFTIRLDASLPASQITQIIAAIESASRGDAC